MKYEVRWKDTYRGVFHKDTVNADSIDDLIDKLEKVAFDNSVGTLDFFVIDVRSERGTESKIFGDLEKLSKMHFEDCEAKDCETVKDSKVRDENKIDVIERLLANYKPKNIPFRGEWEVYQGMNGVVCDYVIERRRISELPNKQAVSSSLLEEAMTAFINYLTSSNTNYEFFRINRKASPVTFSGANTPIQFSEDEKKLVYKYTFTIGCKKKLHDSEVRDSSWLCKAWPTDSDDRKQLNQKLSSLGLRAELQGNDATIHGSRASIEKFMSYLGVHNRSNEIHDSEEADHKIDVRNMSLKSQYEITSYLESHDISYKVTENEITVKTDINSWRMFIQQCGSMHGVKLEDSKKSLSKIHKLVEVIDSIKEVNVDINKWFTATTSDVEKQLVKKYFKNGHYNKAQFERAMEQFKNEAFKHRNDSKEHQEAYDNSKYYPNFDDMYDVQKSNGEVIDSIKDADRFVIVNLTQHLYVSEDGNLTGNIDEAKQFDNEKDAKDEASRLAEKEHQDYEVQKCEANLA